MPITVRQAVQASPPLAAALRTLLAQLTGQPVAVDHATLEQVLAQPGVMLLVAEDEGGGVVGTATLALLRKASGWMARLEDVVVDTSARGRGVGAALTLEAAQLAQAAGAHQLELTSAPHRQAANRLYQRLGFQQHETNVYRLPLTP
ncbi:MAG: GNAT family N-acetyltransferase [Chloroflexota bacterium]